MSISSSVNTLLPAQPDTKDPQLFAELLKIYNAINILASAVAATTQIYAAANGSQASPSYTFIGESTTGAWLPASSQYAVSLNGTTGLYIGTTEIFLGFGAATSYFAGSFNTGIGVNALKNNSSGSGANTALGFGADTVTTTGNINVSIGYQSGPSGNNFTNSLSLGSNAHAQASYEFRYGDNTVLTHKFTAGDMYFPAKVGINGKAPVASVVAPAVPGAVYGATEQTLLNDIRTRLINFGIYT